MATEPRKAILMLRKMVVALIIFPLAVLMIAFAIANRQWVTVSVDPFSSTNPAYMVHMPLFAIIFGSLTLGVLIGGFAAWIGQAKWRRKAHRLNGEVRNLRRELDETCIRSIAAQSGVTQARETANYPSISPPNS